MGVNFSLKLKHLTDIVDRLPDMSLSDLEFLDSHLQLALRFRRQTEVSVDLAAPTETSNTQSYLAEAARQILQGVDEYEITLADQCLLAAVILDEAYGQQTFSNRSLHEEVKLNGRPPIAHITTATAGLYDRAYLIGSSKEAQITTEGKEKARGLVRMFLSQAA